MPRRVKRRLNGARKLSPENTAPTNPSNFHPHVNEFLALLHRESISSFLICNAQHRGQSEALKAVTQLCISIDASNKESLRKLSRPLRRDVGALRVMS